MQTPALETTTGGGDANPFATHHQALDIDVYLRISAGELWQKRLMVAGFPKTFEIGRIFRNEGMSAEHFRLGQCEGYWAYADFKQMYSFLRECYQFVAQETFGTQEIHDARILRQSRRGVAGYRLFRGDIAANRYRHLES